MGMSACELTLQDREAARNDFSAVWHMRLLLQARSGHCRLTAILRRRNGSKTERRESWAYRMTGSTPPDESGTVRPDIGSGQVAAHAQLAELAAPARVNSSQPLTPVSTGRPRPRHLGEGLPRRAVRPPGRPRTRGSTCGPAGSPVPHSGGARRCVIRGPHPGDGGRVARPAGAGARQLGH
jgi:hypothetical protein